MGQIRSDILNVLRRIYRVPGQLQAPDQIDYAHAITMVHDVSREAELASFDGHFGHGSSRAEMFFTIVVDHGHVGATNVTSAIGVYSNQSPTWALSSWIPPNPAEETVWLIRAGVTSTLGAVASAALANDTQPKSAAGSGVTPQIVAGLWTADTSAAMASGLFPLVPTLPDWSLPIPVTNKLLNNTPLDFRSTSTGNDTVDFNVQCIRLPNGIFPPGWR